VSPEEQQDINAVRASFENLDRLATVEMRPRGIPIGLVPQLYALARGEGEPLSLQAARALLECKGQSVAVVTGAIIDGMPKGEIDGPIGACVLASALRKCGVKANVLVPAEIHDVLTGIRDVIGGDVEIIDEEKAGDAFEAAVTVERLGTNRKGVAHTLFGIPVDPPTTFDPDQLIESLNSQGKLTIGIGDAGNEIGFGAIFDETRRLVPLGLDCGCPCHDGLVTSTATQIVYPVAISNYGAYAITAAIGILTEQPDILPDAEVVAAAMYEAVRHGAMDGGTLDPVVPGDDGTPLHGVMAMVTLLRTIASQHFRVMPEGAIMLPVYSLTADAEAGPLSPTRP
jgi:hypothetical protein